MQETKASATRTSTPMPSRTPTPTTTPRPTQATPAPICLPSPPSQSQSKPSAYNYLLKTQLGPGNRDNWLTKVGPASVEATRRRLLLRSTRNHAISEPDLLLSLTTGSSSCCSEAEPEEEEEAEVDPSRAGNVEAISLVSANFKCNDLECSLVLSDYAKCK